MAYRKCTQTKCGLMGSGLCPKCPSCQAKSDEVLDGDTCVECYCCEFDEGYVRDDVEEALKDKLKQKMKDFYEKQRQQSEQVIIKPQEILIKTR